MWDLTIKKGEYERRPIRLRSRASGHQNEAAIEAAEVFQNTKRARTVGNTELPASIRKGGGYVDGEVFKKALAEQPEFVVLYENHQKTHKIMLFMPCLEIKGWFFIEVKNDVKRRSILYPSRAKAMWYYNMQSVIYVAKED